MSWAAPLGVLLMYKCRKIRGLRTKGGPGPCWGARTDRSLPLGPPCVTIKSCRNKNLGETGRGAVGGCHVPPRAATAGPPRPPFTSAGPGERQPDRGSHGAACPRSSASQHSCCCLCPVPPACRSPWHGLWHLGPLQREKVETAWPEGRGPQKPSEMGGGRASPTSLQDDCSHSPLTGPVR